ncbi:MAG: DNA polymerase III subunit gamma/tau [Deltaproteobacteria bacterium]|nr:DNA polymerase III subunit gamma/tau [Deltaproteobacteria bacterium]
MSYLVLARKYRPATFSTVSGQEHVTRTLANSIKRNKVAHAYLFAGPRGVGKTSISRIFAKALNCVKGPTPEPCGECVNCKEIAAGTSLAVREIDGASHNSVDNVRELIDSFRALPAPGSRYKIYIIDEVHMLSTSAFNALLKSLEEPPANTVFILATTEAHKIPETVISRCQRHDFRALSFADIEARLSEIAKAEKLSVEPEALRMVARLADGSMRDAQSLLDRVQSFCEGKITAQETSIALGSVERKVLFSISQAVFQRSSERALERLAECFSSGADPTLFLKEFVAHWRDLLIARFGSPDALQALGVSADEKKELLAASEGISAADLQDLVQLAREGADTALRSAYPKYALEALLVRMATREPVHEVAAIVQHLKGVLSSGSGGGSGGGSRSAPVPASTSTPAAPAAASRSASSVAPVPAAVPTANPADWGKFVSQAGGKVSRMLAEQLKRLAVETFAAGTLKGSGPEFTVNYLNQKANKDQLAKALADYCGGNWAISLQVQSAQMKSAGGAAPATLQESELRERREQEQEKTKSVSNHPKIKRLQEVFSGSTIESIKIR